jgi:hypothetical protein
MKMKPRLIMVRTAPDVKVALEKAAAKNGVSASALADRMIRAMLGFPKPTELADTFVKGRAEQARAS